ncbi:MAG: hypothetical protein EOP19_02765 [Hyphomicrobiales bacterium]|nr:MAG: hypothetical protein EOP19_02765 [Hyphomicrobiales bacterium]
MSMRVMSLAGRCAAVLGVVALLGGCTYDYVQRTDRVAYSAGDAVRANLERETMNPSSRSRYDTRGLGRNGNVTSETLVVQTAGAPHS